MSIPLICRTATTQDAAASPSVAVRATAVATVLALVMSAERRVDLTSVHYWIEGRQRSGVNVPVGRPDIRSLALTCSSSIGSSISIAPPAGGRSAAIRETNVL